MPRWIAQFVLFALLALPASASAADVWTDPAPGIRQLVRTNPGPVRIVAVTIDISRPEYFIRVTRPDERAQTPSSWAAQVGAVVAINGDWSDGSQPVGLSVGDDQHWPGTGDSGWSFMACTLEKECEFDDFTTDQGRYHRWREVVGGNGWRLLIDGNVPQYPNEAFYLSDRHPRSGVGLSADGNTMIVAVAEGRRGDSIGVTFPEFANFFKSLGAHNAMMLDGGGSSALVVNGARQSRLPSAQGSERVVANHLGILRGTPSAECNNVPNGRYCEGSVIHTCQGGQYRGSGDCGFFGASCEVTADGIGVCVHPSCTGGANGHFCEDESVIRSCDYGAPAGAGDCAAFGASCETGGEDSYCVHYMCTEGGNAVWCRDDVTVATCVDGQPEDDITCEAGTVCREGACVEPGEEPSGSGSGAGGNGDGEEDDDRSPPSQSNDDPAGNIEGSEAPDDDPMVVGADGRAGCATGVAQPAWWVLLLAMFAIRVARR